MFHIGLSISRIQQLQYAGFQHKHLRIINNRLTNNS